MRKSALFLFGLVTTAIVALGLVVLSSASAANAQRLYGDPYFFMKRQFVYLGVGIVLAAVIAAIDYRRWLTWPWFTWLFYVTVFVLLCLVFAFPAVKGSQRWIVLGPIRIQPGEFAKLVTVIVISVWMERAAWRVELFSVGAFWPAVLIGILALPVMLEPDFGSTMVIGLVGFLVMYVAGVRRLHMLPFAVLGAVALAYKVINNPNRMARIAAYLGFKIRAGAEVMDKAAEQAAYQVHHALIAIANGGLWGVGLNQSMEKQYYLPEAHTDFIFAIGAEELGLPFTIAVLFLFTAFFALSVYIARKSSDRFGRFLVMGMAFLVFFQAMFNLGVVCEALPTKGMALPFFSYGGTNMLSAFFAVGTILSVGIHSYRDRKRAFISKVVMTGRRK